MPKTRITFGYGQDLEELQRRSHARPGLEDRKMDGATERERPRAASDWFLAKRTVSGLASSSVVLSIFFDGAPLVRAATSAPRVG